jgi:Uma2 family endonuclease
MGAPLTIPRRPISVTDYHKMIDAGVFHEDDRVELIEGELIKMAPMGGAHMQLVNLLNRLLVQQVGEDGVVSPQNPVALEPDSEPEPDFVVFRPECLWRAEVPGSRDVLLIVEVSHSTLAYDRDVKVPLYAQHGIPEVWLFEPTNCLVTIYREPELNTYRRVLTPQRTETISPLLLPNARLSLEQLWPKPAG